MKKLFVKILSITAITLSLTTCYSMDQLPIKSGEITVKVVDVLLHNDLFNSDRAITEMYTPFFFKHNKNNLLYFSEPISSELFSELSHGQKSIYGFTADTIRIITANSILTALGNIEVFGKELAAFYGGLLIQSDDSDLLLLNLYQRLFDDAYYLYVSGGSSAEHADILKQDAAQLYKTNCRKNVEASLSFNSDRQALVVFLAVHKYVNNCSGHAADRVVFCSSGIDCWEMYPVYDFGVFSDDISDFVNLVLPVFYPNGETSTFGYKKAHVDDHSGRFRHELKHGINRICGFTDEDRTLSYAYIERFLDNPFLKDLLFPDFDKILAEITTSIQDNFFELSPKDRSVFFDSIKKHCCLDSTHDIEESFIVDMALKLALYAVDMEWHEAEEVNNIIGLQLLDGLLFVNKLSDMDSFSEKQQAFQWTHTMALNTYCFGQMDELTASVENQAARSFMRAFYEKYMVTTSPLNHPTAKALNMLLKLHGVDYISSWTLHEDD